MLSTSPTAPISFLEAILVPLQRDWKIIICGGAFFFGCQYGSKFIMNRASKKFRELKEEEKDEWCVRFVSCVNSVLCVRQTIMFFTHGLGNRMFLTSDGRADLYSIVPGQSTSTSLLASYFLTWDLPVCLLFNWGSVFFAHGVFSGLGCLIGAYPYADRYTSWYTGTFECSNMFLHSAAMIEQLDGPKAVTKTLKSLFAILFIAIRPIGGTYVFYQLARATYAEHLNNYQRCHNPAAAWGLVAVAASLLSLQWMWSGTIVRSIGAALGLCAEPESGGDKKADEKKKKMAAAEAAPLESEDNKTK